MTITFKELKKQIEKKQIDTVLVALSDMQGRLIIEQKNLKSTSAVISNLKATHQVLIVKITSEDNSMVTKKVVN